MLKIVQVKIFIHLNKCFYEMKFTNITNNEEVKFSVTHRYKCFKTEINVLNKKWEMHTKRDLNSMKYATYRQKLIQVYHI